MSVSVGARTRVSAPDVSIRFTLSGAFKFDGSFCICLHFIVLAFSACWVSRSSSVTIRENCHEIRLPAVT